MTFPIQEAPGSPGIPARWTSSAKSGVGTALSDTSRVWFTLSHGIFDEIYYPRVDQACIRDLGLIVTDGKNFFSEEKRDTQHEIAPLLNCIPAYQLTNTCNLGRYRIEKEILSDPERDVVLQQVQFTPLKGHISDYHLYVLLAPHLANHGSGNTAWIGTYKGIDMLFAERGSIALALASSAAWAKRSAGFVGASDGWQDLYKHKKLTWDYARAENGNVALVGEIDLKQNNGTFTLALGFGLNSNEAGYRALASLNAGFEHAKQSYIRQWKKWQRRLTLPSGSSRDAEAFFKFSASIVRTHEAKRFPGGFIASLSIPWGFAKGDDDLGGYHLVWPRDLVEAAEGLLAAGAHEEATRVLEYLQTTQEADGHWPQNMWLDGAPYWIGVQMDETALPILFVDLARRERALTDSQLTRFWPMVRKAAAFLIQNGPITQQDRWEEDPGFSPFTLAVEIAALVAAADLAQRQGESELAAYLLEIADAWNSNIERWTYVTGTNLASELGVEGYYIRIAPPETAEAASPRDGFVPIKNRPPGETDAPAEQLISPDVLALVRFGLRDPKDPRILNTIKVIDAALKTETPAGPVWHRYNGDGYGEHADGEPFDGEGIGRAWPLLTGERAHYELAKGDKNLAQRLQQTMISLTERCGLLPEQVWDTDDIPEKELFFGRASGSAKPLVWAHAEYLKLARSLEDGRVFDTPTAVYDRYVRDRQSSNLALWRFNHKLRSIPQGKILRIETFSPARIRWSNEGGDAVQEVKTKDSGMGVHFADLSTTKLKEGDRITFSIVLPDSNDLPQEGYSVYIAGA
jgi:glucoamylase